MKRFLNILVAVDTRFEEHPILDEAAKLAHRNKAALRIVDVLPEFSKSIRSSLPEHDHVRELLIDEKRAKLEGLARPLRDSGLSVETDALSGKTSVEIIRTVLREDHDLVMRVAKGKSSLSARTFGSTGFQLLRNCPCAVWLVNSSVSSQPSRILACVDAASSDGLDAELNEKVFAHACELADVNDARVSLITAWSLRSDAILQGHISRQTYEKMVDMHEKRLRQQLAQVMQNGPRQLSDDDMAVANGDTAEMISQHVKKTGTDLLVMGTVARSGFLGMVMGNTAERILDQVECSVLALKPASFACPIHLMDDAVAAKPF
jgi:universal stress protein E